MDAAERIAERERLAAEARERYRRKSAVEEDTLPDEKLSEEQRKRRDARIYKREQRKRLADVKQAAINAANVSSREEFWALNLKQLEPAALAALQEREAAVLELMQTVQDYVQGRLEVLDDEDKAWLDETIAAVKECGWFNEHVALIPFHTQDEKKFLDAVVQSGGPTADFIRTGIFTALPSSVYEAFRGKFMTRRYTVPAYWETIACACGTVDHVPTGIAADYQKARMNYLCHKCREAERRSREIAKSHTATVRDGFYPFDKFGRVL
jgi:hypothetical protein